jgi:hypothetical protein
MFYDAFLQVVGLCVLSEVYRLHPEFNNPGDYVNVEFGAAHNGEEDKYTLHSDYVTRVEPIRLLQEFGEIVQTTVRNMRWILERKAERVVGGTMRMHVTINHFEHSQIQFNLAWISTGVS